MKLYAKVQQEPIVEAATTAAQLCCSRLLVDIKHVYTQTTNFISLIWHTFTQCVQLWPMQVCAELEERASTCDIEVKPATSNCSPATVFQHQLINLLLLNLNAFPCFPLSNCPLFLVSCIERVSIHHFDLCLTQHLHLTF
jgi:hypothetical protein